MEIREASARYVVLPKQTELGLIPEDWDVVSVGSIASFQSGEGISVSELDQQSSDTPIPVYGGNGIAGYTARAVTHDQTVVVGRVGQKCGEVYLTSGPAWISDNALFPRSFNCDVDIQFFALALKMAGLNDLKNRNDLPLVTQSILHSVQIPLPRCKVEQQDIAKALSDADALVDSLEQLLAKKRQLKQGVTHSLLSGTKRLPGFDGEWATTRLGELGSTFGGLSGKMKQDFGHGSARYISFMNIMANVVIDCGILEPVDVKPAEAQNYVAKGDLFFNGSSETPEEVGMCAVLLEDVEHAFLNSFCFGFRLRDATAADGLYLAYLFRSRVGRKLLRALAQGATRYNLSKVALLKRVFKLPTRREQIAIAAVLSDIDAQIAALEAKVTKARNVKQGMAQTLLTGSIRLV